MNNNEQKLGEKLIALNFISVDQHISHSIISKNKSKFSEIEKALYMKYPEYLKNENFFMWDGTNIDKLKTLEENGIIGYTIMLKTIDNE